MSLNQRHSEQRLYPRSKLHLRAMLVSGRRLHHTHIENMSLGGALLDTAPERDFLNYPVIHLLIHDSESSIQLVFKVAFVDHSQRRLKFLDLEQAHIGLLNKWISEQKTLVEGQKSL